jgi:phosphoglycolate phosphatase-like HAD superfamily hydrolase
MALQVGIGPIDPMRTRRCRSDNRQYWPAKKSSRLATVVGDSVWDMLAAQRARALGVGLLSGGYSRDELERSGAYRVYEDPADLLKHIDEVGGRR